MKRNNILSFAISAILIGSVAFPVFAGKIVKSGATACSGAYYYRKSLQEKHDFSYSLRNLNDDRTITITRIQAWDVDGNLTPECSLDPSYCGLVHGVDGFRVTLGPHQAAVFKASDIMVLRSWPYQAQQIRVDYTLDKPGMRLSVGAHRNVFVGGWQVAKEGSRCTIIPPRAIIRHK